MPDSGGLSAQALEEALAIAGLGCWVWRQGESTPAVSANFHKLLHCLPEALPVSPDAWLQLAHVEDQAALTGLFSQLSGARFFAPVEFPLRLRDANGAWVWFVVKARAISDNERIVTFNDITLQKQTEATLRDSQLRYRALYATAPLAFILWNRNGHITEWNQRAEVMFGWQSAEVIGKPVHRLLLPVEQHEAFTLAVKRLSHGSNGGEFSGPAIGKHGQQLQCTWYSVALRNAQGNLIGILSLVLDITEEKLAQQQLLKSEKTYRTLVETSPDAILLLGLDGRINMANQQAQTLFGLNELEDSSNRKLQSIFPDSGEAVTLLQNPEDYTGFIVNRDLQMYRIDHGVFDASIAFTTILDSQGEPSGIVLFARDVTEKLRAARELENHRKNLEQLVQERTRELEATRDSLAQIIDGSPVPTFVLNAEHVITHWNKACEGVMGIPAEQMIGTKEQWRAFYDTPRPVMADLVMTGQMELVEQLYQTKYRRSKLVAGGFEAEDYFESFKRSLFFTAAPLHNAAGEVIGAIETLQDVSERKQAEIALMDAKSVAELAAKTKAEFLANMSHEIRTPMNAVIGLSHLLQKTELSRKQYDYVGRIQGAGQMLLGLINDVLDFSKIEAGRMQLEHTEFTLDQVLTNVATVVITRAQEKGLELQYVVEPDLPHSFLGDPLRLTQILVNLIGNAIKFTAKGAVTAFFRRIESADERILLEIDVQDSGIGMSMAQQGLLFQAFTQADTSITRNYGGTGLGLTISKRLVELMGGNIWVTSQPNIGSTFSFQVFLGEHREVAAAPVALSPLRALVVDDNPLARTVLQRLLQKYGCHTESVPSGKEALTILADPLVPAFDYVTIDLNMPEMDGLQLAAAIQHLPLAPPKLVLVTASDTHAMEESGELRHFHAALNKPITAAQIGELLTGTSPLARHDNNNRAALAGLRILLAEDVPTNQLIATEMLQSFGARVETADNGRLAIEAMADHGEQIDLILMDMQMPEIDGLEATRHIRKTYDAKKLPIIAMTAHALDEERQRCLAAGMDDFITKPVDPLALLNTLLRWKPSGTKPMDTNPTPTPPPVVPPSTTDGLPDLPGIDKANGLKRMMNKVALYERVLRDFHTRFAGEAALIRAALAANDLPTAERHVHSTKGLSGSIGALALQAASLALEDAIRGGNGYPESALIAYENELAIVLNGISSGFKLTVGPA